MKWTVEYNDPLLGRDFENINENNAIMEVGAMKMAFQWSVVSPVKSFHHPKTNTKVNAPMGAKISCVEI